jgi:hypothetical protein
MYLTACIEVDRSVLAGLQPPGSPAYDPNYATDTFVSEVIFKKRWRLGEVAFEFMELGGLLFNVSV